MSDVLIESPDSPPAETPLAQYINPREMFLASVYFINGPVPKGRFENPRYEVRDPPVGGYTSVIVFPNKGRSTIFEPVNFWSDQVPNTCAELRYCKLIDWTPEKIAQMTKIILRQWDTWARFGYQVDYDLAASILRKFGASIPTTQALSQIDPATGQAKVRGGKELNTQSLRPMRRDTKRGQIAAFFIEASERKSIREAMAQFGLTRSAILSHLFCMNRDHGLPYRLQSDCAIIDVPEGFDPFGTIARVVEEQEEEDGTVQMINKTVEAKPVSGPKGKPLEADRFTPLKPGNKRAAVAEFFLNGGSIDEYVTKVGLTRSGVLSHLYTIWMEHGVGHEVYDDGKSARLLVPEGVELWLAAGEKPKKNASTAVEEPPAASDPSAEEDWLN